MILINLNKEYYQEIASSVKNYPKHPDKILKDRLSYGNSYVHFHYYHPYSIIYANDNYGKKNEVSYKYL